MRTTRRISTAARLLRAFAAIAFVAFALVLSSGAVPAAAGGFSFNWTGTPATPQRWTPRATNDWDLIASNDSPTDLAGTMSAQHGADCAAPPAAHTIRALTDSAYVCNNHLMTAINGGGDAAKTYAAVYFTPAQLVDMRSGTAQINWQISTQRQSMRDWWDVWLTPWSENEVMPQQNLPAFNGPPRDALHLFVDNSACTHNQAYGYGSIVYAVEYHNFQPSAQRTTFSCIEDEAVAAGASGPSPTVRAPLELDVSQTHARLFVVGQTRALADLAVSLSSPLAVVQWSHQSYNPQKDCPGPCGPNTFHWSNIAITPSVPFTMLRPAGTASVHAGTVTRFTLPQPAPAGSFLRFAALGSIQVSVGGGPFQAARRQTQDGPASDGSVHDEQMSNYWTPIPAGTTSIAFAGGPNWLAPTWWVQDVSVWSLTAPAGPSPSPSATATPRPTPTPTPTRAPTPAATPTPRLTPTPAPIASNRIQGFFLAGANMAWINFGSDFGGGSGDVARNTAAVDAKFSAAKAAGIHVVRWWMFEGGSPQIQRDAGGTPTGLNPRVYTDIDAAVAEAAKYQISLDLVLFDGTDDDATTHAWWTNPSMRIALRNVLLPLFQRYANQTRIQTWEIVNEPDWQIRNGQTDQASATALVNLLADAVHANSHQLVTVGQAQIQDMASWAGAHIDYYSPHYYDNFGTTGGGDPFQQPAKSRDGKPVVIGEFEAGPGQTPSARQRYQALYDGGYAGAWMWSLTPEATSDGFSLDGQGVAAFAAGKRDVGPRT